MSETHRFSGPFVFRCKNPNHSELKNRLLPLLIERADESVGKEDWNWDQVSGSTVRTNYLLEKQNPWGTFTHDDLIKIVNNPVNELLNSGENFGKLPSDFKLKAIWWNRYPAGATAPAHCHSGSMSGVYILEQNEPCPLKFHHTNHFGLDPDGGLQEEYQPLAEEGDVLLFPATLMHWVLPTKDWRTTISFNLAPIN